MRVLELRPDERRRGRCTQPIQHHLTERAREWLISRGLVKTASRTSTALPTTAPRMRTPSRGTARLELIRGQDGAQKALHSVFGRGAPKWSSAFRPEPSAGPNWTSKSAGLTCGNSIPCAPFGCRRSRKARPVHSRRTMEDSAAIPRGSPEAGVRIPVTISDRGNVRPNRVISPLLKGHAHAPLCAETSRAVPRYLISGRKYLVPTRSHDGRSDLNPSCSPSLTTRSVSRCRCKRSPPCLNGRL